MRLMNKNEKSKSHLETEYGITLVWNYTTTQLYREIVGEVNITILTNKVKHSAFQKFLDKEHFYFQQHFE